MLSDGLKGSYPNMGTQKSLPPNGILFVLWDQFCYSMQPVVLAQANTKVKSLRGTTLNEH